VVTRSLSVLRADTLLRRALLGNVFFSTLCGVLLVIDSGPFDTLLGLGSPTALTILGVLTLLGAAVVAWVASRPTIDRGSARAIVAMDVAWVVGSIILLLAGLLHLTGTGNWVVGAIAVVVADFALLQSYGISRLSRG
jgi:hypothetical protein